jgi:hypothetical protein
MTQGKELWSSRYTARCACGYGIACELWLEYGGSTFVVPFDNEETSETYGEQVERCRRCGTKLAVPESLWRHEP